MNDRIIFFSLISVFIISTFWWLYLDVWQYGGEISGLEKKLSGIEDNFIMLAQIEESYDEVKERHSTIISRFDSLKATIPTLDTYANVIEEVRKIADKQSLKIESFRPEMDDSYPALKTKLNFTELHIERRPIQLRVYGNYFTIGSFLEEILELNEIINIHSIEIETELSESNIISCDLVLFAYIYFEKNRKV